MEKLDVGVIGAGYVGLATGACLAHVGHRIILVDVDVRRVESLGRGDVPIYEPGLAEFVSRGAQRLRFTTELAPVVHEAEDQPKARRRIFCRTRELVPGSG